MAVPPITYEDVTAAADRLEGVAVRTPLLESERLNARLGGRVLVKAETLQRTGSFKFRGAYNAISRSDARAVVAFSSGNHAQGVAAAARLLGKAATIVMPKDAPRTKVEGTRALGAEIVLYDRYTEDREPIGRRIAEETGAELVKPFDDVRVMAGQGTAGLELVAQAAALGAQLDAVLVCCSGGGLLAGIATAVAHASPPTEIIVCEPVGFDDMGRSLTEGRRVGNAPGGRTICDALMSPIPGELTFEVIRHHVRRGLAVTDDEVLAAMREAFLHLKLVIEPGGAVPLACLTSGRLPLEGRTVAVVASGANVDPEMFARALAAA